MGNSGNKEKNKDSKLNKILIITLIIFVLSGALAITIILNKGVIFGKRLVTIAENASAEPIHVIQIVSTNNYLKNVGDIVELKISIDGQDVANRRRI